MKTLKLIFEIVTAFSAIAAAWFWYRSSRVKVNAIEVMAGIEPSYFVQNEGQIEPNYMPKVREQSKLNQRAAFFAFISATFQAGVTALDFL